MRTTAVYAQSYNWYCRWRCVGAFLLLETFSGFWRSVQCSPCTATSTSGTRQRGRLRDVSRSWNKIGVWLTHVCLNIGDIHGVSSRICFDRLYYLGFGTPGSLATFFYPTLISNGIFALIFPVVGLQQHATPPCCGKLWMNVAAPMHWCMCVLEVHSAVDRARAIGQRKVFAHKTDAPFSVMIRVACGSHWAPPFMRMPRAWYHLLDLRQQSRTSLYGWLDFAVVGNWSGRDQRREVQTYTRIQCVQILVRPRDHTTTRNHRLKSTVWWNRTVCMMQLSLDPVHIHKHKHGTSYYLKFPDRTHDAHVLASGRRERH